MSIIKGKVQAIKQWEKNYGLKINDVWISGKGICPTQKDDNVMIDTVKNGKYTNIKSIELMDVPIQQKAGDMIPSIQTSPTAPASVLHKTFDEKRNDTIMYSVCLKVAGTILSAQKELPTPAGVVMYADDLFKEVRKK